MTVVELKHQAKLQEWQERIMECRSSGQSVAEWCREYGVTPTTYYRWEREIFGKAKDTRGQSMSLVQSGAVFAELPTPKGSSLGTPIMTIRMGGMAVDIYPGADAGTIAALCQVLRGC